MTVVNGSLMAAYDTREFAIVQWVESEAKMPALMCRLGGQEMMDQEIGDLVAMIWREHEHDPDKQL